MSILRFYFGWPLGAIWGNLAASGICAALIWWRIRARMIAHHLAQLAQAERHHKDMKAHVTTMAAAGRPQKRLAPRTTAPPGGDPA